MRTGLRAVRVRSLLGSRRRALWGGLGLLALLSYLTLVVSSRSLVPVTAVASNSMAPFLHRGDLVVLEHAAPKSVAVDDVVAFDVPPVLQKQYGYPRRIIHRVVSVEDGGRELRFQTKGDNTLADPFSVSQNQLKGRYRWSLPGVGYVLLYLQSRQGQLFLLVVLAVLLVYEYGGAMRNAVRSALGVPPAGVAAPVATAAAPQPATPVVEAALESFAASMKEYAVHLQSHTAVMMNLREVTASLQQSVEAQTRLLARLEGSLPPTPEAPREPPTK